MCSPKLVMLVLTTDKTRTIKNEWKREKNMSWKTPSTIQESLSVTDPAETELNIVQKNTPTLLSVVVPLSKAGI